MTAPTETKHTPGPYYVHPNTAHIMAEGDETPIAAMCWPTDARSEAETRANAELFAAAPQTAAERDRLKALNAELVAALKEARALSTSTHGTARGEIYRVTFAAIAKAEGRK